MRTYKKHVPAKIVPTPYTERLRRKEQQRIRLLEARIDELEARLAIAEMKLTTLDRTSEPSVSELDTEQQAKFDLIQNDILQQEQKKSKRKNQVEFDITQFLAEQSDSKNRQSTNQVTAVELDAVLKPEKPTDD